MKSQTQSTRTFHRVYFLFSDTDSASNLKRVDLSHNYLESLSPDIKSDIFTDSLVSIKLNDNYWICDCHLRYESIMYYIHIYILEMTISSCLLMYIEKTTAQYVSRAHCLNSQNLDRALQRGTLLCIIIILWRVTELYRRLGNLGNCTLDTYWAVVFGVFWAVVSSMWMRGQLVILIFSKNGYYLISQCMYLSVGLCTIVR